MQRFCIIKIILRCINLNNIKILAVCLLVISLLSYLLLGFHGFWSLVVIGFLFILLPLPILRLLGFSLEESFFYSFFVSVITLSLIVYYVNLVVPLNIALYLVITLLTVIDIYLVFSKKVSL